MHVRFSRSSLHLLSLGLLVLLLVTDCAPSPPARVEPTAEPTSTADGRSARKSRLQSSVFVDNVELPSAMTFAPDGRMFFVEVFAGRVRVVENGVLKPEPVATFRVQQGSESGLLGLALDPDFTATHFIYAYYSEPDANDL